MKFINFIKPNILLAYYLCFALGLALVAANKPALNWDMIGYAAAAKHFEISDPNELHTYIFEELKNTVSKTDYFRLTNNNNQRRIDVATHADLFYQQMPFFEMRPIYSLSILAVSKLGVNLFTASYLISIVTVFFGVIILFFAIRDKIHTGFLYILPWFLVSFGLLSVAQLSTPDGLAFLVLCLFIYLFNYRCFLSLLLILPLFVLVRTDFIIFIFLILSAIFILYQQYRVKVIFSFIATIILYLGVNHIFHNYGWTILFYNSFIKRISNPANVNISISIMDYLHALIRGLHKSLKDYPFYAFLCLSSINLVFIHSMKIRLLKNKDIWIYVIVPVLYVAFHFLLFPATWRRFFIGFYLMNVLSLFMLLTQQINKYKRSMHNSNDN